MENQKQEVKIRHSHHEELIQGIREEYSEILQHSDQGVYIYLDDIHKVFNKKLATMLGYSSPSDIENVNESFVDMFVSPRSQDTLISAYQKAMDSLSGSTIDITWKMKSDGVLNTRVILVPIKFKGHLFALHFVTEK